MTPPEELDAREEQLRRSRAGVVARSEEHTSELQSHVNLVCRLLLEKKKGVVKFEGNWNGYLGGALMYREQCILFIESGSASVSFVHELVVRVTDVQVLHEDLCKAHK